ncbi:MAG: hypothetical protein JW779_14420 [Candidatus Thorarchaeota archaeon]|nr:hypothetical protein [Candidatus Thorarchaeota archaeon]
MEELSSIGIDNREIRFSELEEKLKTTSKQVNQSIGELETKVVVLGPYQTNGDRRLRVTKRKAEKTIAEFESMIECVRLTPKIRLKT